MKNKLRLLAVVLTVAMLLVLLSACGSTSSDTASGNGEYQTIRLVMAVNGSDTQIDSKVANKMKEIVEEESGGSITIDVFPNDQLAGGNASKGIEMIAQGSCDLAAYATSTLAVIDDKLNVCTIPWSFDDYEQVADVIDKSGYKYYTERLGKKGITYLASFHNGFRQLTNSKRAVKTPEDMKNLKIRVPGSEIYMGFFRTLGADPTSMSFSEVYTAIQQGTIDGQENGVSITYANKMAEVQDYLTMWNYSYDTDLVIANTTLWESLEPKTQELLSKASKEASDWGRKQVEDEQETILKEFKEGGMTITYLTDEELDAFKEVIADWRQGIIDQYGKDACSYFKIK